MTYGQLQIDRDVNQVNRNRKLTSFVAYHIGIHNITALAELVLQILPRSAPRQI